MLAALSRMRGSRSLIRPPILPCIQGSRPLVLQPVSTRHRAMTPRSQKRRLIWSKSLSTTGMSTRISLASLQRSPRPTTCSSSAWMASPLSPASCRSKRPLRAPGKTRRAPSQKSTRRLPPLSISSSARRSLSTTSSRTPGLSASRRPTPSAPRLHLSSRAQVAGGSQKGMKRQRTARCIAQRALGLRGRRQLL